MLLLWLFSARAVCSIRTTLRVNAAWPTSPSPITIGVGCTGGRHRSVYVAERLGKDLAAAGYPVRIAHRDDLREGP
jgi:RNase adaptor protein for sRNA GlmZ degradation